MVEYTLVDVCRLLVALKSWGKQSQPIVLREGAIFNADLGEILDVDEFLHIAARMKSLVRDRVNALWNSINRKFVLLFRCFELRCILTNLCLATFKATDTPTDIREQFVGWDVSGSRIVWFNFPQSKAFRRRTLHLAYYFVTKFDFSWHQRDSRWTGCKVAEYYQQIMRLVRPRMHSASIQVRRSVVP